MPGTRPPLGQNVFIFMQFSGKIRQIVGWRPPLGLTHPPLGNPRSATELSNMTVKNLWLWTLSVQFSGGLGVGLGGGRYRELVHSILGRNWRNKRLMPPPIFEFDAHSENLWPRPCEELRLNRSSGEEHKYSVVWHKVSIHKVSTSLLIWVPDSYFNIQTWPNSQMAK